MDSNLALINFDFGTKQLSGNLALYTRLLGRFASDYELTCEKLAEIDQLNNLEEMQLLVHTIKGVSGNLGLDHLHHSARGLDDALKSGSTDPQLLAELKSSVKQTLSEIKRYEQEGNTNENPVTNASISKQQLVEELQKQRFISDEKLSTFLETSDLAIQHQQNLKNAIDELDYAVAIEILESY